MENQFPYCEEINKFIQRLKMKNNLFKKTISFYKENLLGDILILVLSILGGLIGNYYDFFHLKRFFTDEIIIAIYTLLCILLSFPLVILCSLLWRYFKRLLVFIKSKKKINLEGLRLADGMLRDTIWKEYDEHTLTLINETGHDIKKCHVMLDEVAWKNDDGKLDIDSGDRASFVFISHNQYSVYNTTKKQNVAATDFNFIFSKDQHANIGYGPNIRMRISIRGKLDNGVSIEPITYLLYVKLLQAHGIPKVDVVKRRRLS